MHEKGGEKGCLSTYGHGPLYIPKLSNGGACHDQGMIGIDTIGAICYGMIIGRCGVMAYAMGIM